jgi:carbon storage regulator
MGQNSLASPCQPPDRKLLPHEVLDWNRESETVMGDRSITKEWNMLVLSRKKNESIVINDDITIVVVEIRGDKVRLGVEAPKEVPVHRREVYDAIKRSENEQRGNRSSAIESSDEN